MNAGYDVLKNRRSIRRFRSDDVPRELIEKVVEAGLYAPSAMGTQHTVIVVVTDRGLRDELSKRNAEIAGIEDGRDPFYGAPAVLVVLTKSDWQNKVYDGSLVMGNLMNAAHALGLGSCWIHRAKQEFETEWGRQLLRSLGVSGEYEGIGHCVLGYVDGDLPQPAPRKEGRVFYADCLFGGRAAAERGESVRTSGEINSSAANSG